MGKSEWRAHIQRVSGEFKAARVSVARLKDQVNIDATTIAGEPWVREHLAPTHANLEGTYIVRMFTTSEAAIRSFDRQIFDDPERETKPSVLIDQLGSKKRLRVRTAILEGVHRVRRIRNYWAHDTDANLEPIPIERVRGLVQAYLDKFPPQWG